MRLEVELELASVERAHADDRHCRGAVGSGDARCSSARGQPGGLDHEHGRSGRVLAAGQHRHVAAPAHEPLEQLAHFGVRLMDQDVAHPHRIATEWVRLVSGG